MAGLWFYQNGKDVVFFLMKNCGTLFHGKLQNHDWVFFKWESEVSLVTLEIMTGV